MSDGDALLSAILARPDEDVPRLAYADWLDENGDDPDRAEFVRVQVALARGVPDEERRAFEAREKKLLSLHALRWLEPLRERGGPLESGNTHGQFRRGFVEVLWMPAAWFITRAHVLFARVPARELRVTRTTIEELATLVHGGFLLRLSALDLSDRGLGDDAAQVLARSRAAAALSVLRLSGCGLTDLAARRLATAPFDWPLRELDVRHNPITAAGLAALRDRFGAAVVASRPVG